MNILNIEIKARTERTREIRQMLLDQGADFRGTDHQIDSYFNCDTGRLKLREGTIENSLIHYHRADQSGPKASHVALCRLPGGTELREVLAAALGVWKTVDKKREIYFIDNVKFHLDQVRQLGEFVEIEAIDTDGSAGEETLRAQCDHYIGLLGIRPQDLLERSYSDMV